MHLSGALTIVNKLPLGWGKVFQEEVESQLLSLMYSMALWRNGNKIIFSTSFDGVPILFYTVDGKHCTSCVQIV